MGHPAALESLLPFIAICALLVGISNSYPLCLSYMAEPIEDQKETKGQEMGWDEARPTDEGVFSRKLLGQVDVEVDEGGHAACYLKAVESKGEACIQNN